MRLRILPGVLVLVSLCIAHGAFAGGGDSKAPVKLLPGYKHQAGKAIHGPRGEITKEDGLKITYEFGKVRREGDPITSADFTDRAQALPKAERKWFKQQKVGGQPVNLAYSKKGILYVSYPGVGANFQAAVKTPEDMADALLMILSLSWGEKVKG